MHVIFRIAFTLVVAINLTLIALNFYFAFDLGDSLSPVSLIESIFPIIALVAVWSYQENHEQVKLLCNVYASSVMTSYVAWCVFSLLFNVFLCLVRLNVINLGESNASASFAYIFGSNGQQVDQRIFIIGIVIMVEQIITLPFSTYIRFKTIAREDIEFKGFA
ncbi:hypothetical protein MIR68_006653 [Amoeboaphelidium protococcarum]|nr:hypothetical protein MIR68_006653 [Amoeboaphelidium protococcarum]